MPRYKYPDIVVGDVCCFKGRAAKAAYGNWTVIRIDDSASRRLYANVTEGENAPLNDTCMVMLNEECYDNNYQIEIVEAYDEPVIEEDWT